MSKKPDNTLRDVGLLVLCVVILAASKLWYAQEQGTRYGEQLLEWARKL